ncbi:Laminin subunit alpha [Holothuria leucospilota]|uniref:Laminin subunit alpha n=1 Tax=Holothuria leucospilota TaxID=206669 RepID=A0A9Q1BU53_HOLLE|nr:Laminin subunit alpha [Holothuria leucospilota]
MGFSARQLRVLFVGITLVLGVKCQQPNILTPTYFNVAEGKEISATATCGDGFAPPGERYCKLTGNTADVIRPGEQEIIQGQYCDYCLESDPVKFHPIKQAIDGTEKWWQSPPLSRGMHYNEVNITIDLGQLYHIAYVIIKSANSPRPGRFILERSRDYGETYQPWQYFAESESDCLNTFGMASISDITNDDDVICTAEYSNIVPLEDGEIVVSLVNDRPGSNNFSYSETLQEWTKATNIRLRLLRTNTLLGHLMGLARQDPTVTRRYYYSIKDISVGGRCVCNGHADTCDTPGPDGRLICTCSHNTCGTECEYCCPGFVQKKWKPATLESSHECEPCNCHGHSSDCNYDEEVARNRLSLDIYGNYEGGGVCVDCQHNTTGINCELCQDGFYRQGGLSLDSPDVCQACQCDPYFSTGNCAPITGQCECRPQFTGPDCGECSEGYYDFPTCKPCDCNVNGTEGKICQADGGQCPCKPNYLGLNCDLCAPGFYNFPECIPCECDRSGSTSSVCHPDTGQCTCRDVFQKRSCDECQRGFYDFPYCQPCSCSPYGVTEDICNATTGRCICKENFDGPNCDRCKAGYFNYPYCVECSCDKQGSLYESCTSSGQCYCRPGFTQDKCDECGYGYFRYPDCLACNCSQDGATSVFCDDPSGQCSCRGGYQGRMCDMCAEGFYNYPNCEECNCNPAGVIDIPGEPLGGCGQATQGACLCKENVIGRTCDSCAPRYFNLARSNPAGCEECDCYVDGTIGGLAICDMSSGQCLCKAAVDGRKCDVCKDGFYNLQGSNAFGCVECGCDVGGSIHGVCDKVTGQCICRPRISGRTCSEPAQLHFFPSLHQIKFEIESGTTPDGGRPRIGYDPIVFPGFSYLGYAVMSSIQPVVLVTINVDRSSIYRIVLRYVYDGSITERGHISVMPSSDRLGSEQSSDILFIPGPDPQFVTVEGGGIVMPFVLNPGEWTIRIEAPEGALLDYLVLLPSAFYEATVLLENVANPCIVTEEQERCNYYVFPGVDEYPNVRGTTGYYYDVNTNQQIRIRQFVDEYIRDQLDVIDLAHLDEEQSNLGVTIPFDKPGDYVFIVEYYGGGPDQQRATFDVFEGDQTMTGFVNFYNCSYLCRSIVVNAEGEVQVFSIEQEQLSVVLTQIGQPFFLAVSAIIAIPVSEFSYEFITPALECIRTSSGQCLGSTYPIPPGSTLTDLFDNDPDAPTPPNFNNPSTTFKYISTPDGPTTVVVEINLPSPGRYVYVIHYYQPYSAGFEVDFKIPGELNGEGSFNAKYCPHVSGCRVVVVLPDGSNVFELTGDGQSIQISVPDSEDENKLWVDYILAIPEDQFNDDILKEIPFDRAGDFITYCAHDDFFINMEAPDICKNSVFSISTDFNNGAFSCNCDPSGSTSFTCEQIGGQCPCRANIVGRQCDRCAIGYYGFPNCRPCNCPNNICNEVTGECICPENVIGTNCDRCAPGTYGYDPLAGCVECGCDERGIEGSDSVCDSTTGQCRCKPNVGGRQCDQCLNGYYQFPFCLPCDCDPAGTLPQICDQTTAQCLCKDNVVGEGCDECAPGSFNLDEDNSQGCISCFCFGVTDICKSYTRNREAVAFREEWGVTNLDDPLVRYNGQLVNVYVNGQGSDPQAAIYWIPPSNWIGSKLNSYGGFLKYRVHNNPPQNAPYQPIRRPDVVIRGNGITITYSNLEQPQPSRSYSVAVKMVENNFQYSFRSRPVSREDFLMVLANIDSFQIRAQYFDTLLDASLSEMSLDVTRRDGTGEVASSVERCTCPPEYTGLSCEQCAPGHYRISRGTFLGQCVPCQCNNHSNKCDPDTGYCFDCQDNTEGPQCQTCRTGYRGNGTEGTDEECEICACPEAREDQNFAETCDVNENNELVCICLEGHTGQYCEQCEEGYFGDPSRPNGRCRRCDCSGNTDTDRPGAECDSLYGNCLKCQEETKGDHCEECADWYFGDAEFLKSCQLCDCDRYGSESCNGTTGECYCKPNVVGARCDRCAPYHYGFGNPDGCIPCGCAVASRSYQCDVNTGQCDCLNGVEGLKCDRCSEDYFGYSPNGCDSCRCGPKLRCDPIDGQCLCPPGATGPLCDQCEERYVLTDAGCLPCDDCVHELLDMLDAMDFSMDANHTRIYNVSVGVTSVERLQQLNDTTQTMENMIDIIAVNNIKMEMLLGPTGDELDARKDLARKTLKQGRKTDAAGAGLLNVTHATLERAKTIATKINQTFSSIKDQAERTAPAVNQSISISEMLDQAEEILNEIRGRNHSAVGREAEMELEAANELLNRVMNLRNTSDGLLGRLYNVSESMDQFEGKIDELLNQTIASYNNTRMAETAMGQNYSTELEESQTQIEQMHTQANNEEQEALNLVEDADVLLDTARAAVQVTAANASTLDAAITKLDTGLANLQMAFNNSDSIVENATTHAANLTAQAALLEGLLVSTKELAENALNAANAYSNIVNAIEDAERAALNAKNASSLADGEASGFGTQPADSLKKSNKLVKKAEKASKRLRVLEDELNEAAESVDEAMHKLDTAEVDLSQIERGMAAIPSAISECEIQVCTAGDATCKPGFMGDNCNVALLSEQAFDAKMTAMDASTRAEATAAAVDQISQQLPLLEDLVKITIPDNIDETNIEAAEAQTAVTDGREILSNFRDLEQDLLDRHSLFLNISNRVLGDLAVIREQIDYARTLAQGIQVAAKLEDDSILQLRTPEVKVESKSATSLSMYFTTTQPNALLFYGAGPDPSEGYVALEIVNGNLIFKYNLGDDDVEVPVALNVADGQWHQVIADRTGKYGTVRVYTAGMDVAEGSAKSDGVLTLLQIADKWGLFVGGVTQNYTLPSAVSQNPFVGGIDQIYFNQNPVGVWDFESATNVDDGILRYQNSTDLSQQLDPDDEDSVMFDGNGFLKVKNPVSGGGVLPLSLSFKTQAQAGLLVFAKKGTDFMSLELEGGRVVLRVSIDGETVTLKTSRRYNNNEWTSVDVDMFGPLSLAVNQNGREETWREEFVTTEEMNPVNYLFFGGLVGIRDTQYPSVTRRGFLGCLKTVRIFRDAIDLLGGVRSKGLYPSCIPQDTRLVSFPAPYGGYVGLNPLDFYDIGAMVINFRAHRPSGLIAYLADDLHEDVMAVQLVDGRVEAVFGKEVTDITRVESNEDTYDDGMWHSVSISKISPREVGLIVDDVDVAEANFRTRTSVITDGVMFIGGLPSSLPYNKNAIPDLQPFVGCIADVSVGAGESGIIYSAVNVYLSYSSVQNFALRLTDLSASYNFCPDEAENVTQSPTEPPVIPTTRTVTPTVAPEECKLGLLGSAAVDPLDAGAGFLGATNESRYEFESLGREYVTQDEMYFGLKTAAEYGVLYYTADARQFDFTSLYLEDGYLVYTFDYGSGAVVIQSNERINDNQWHEVRTMREGSLGVIFIDGQRVGQGQLTGTSRYLSVETPLYVGGIPSDLEVDDIPLRSRASLIGCIKDFTVDPPREKLSEFEVPQCRGSREPGVFFGQYDGYLILDNTFNVGVNIEISLEIKPRKTTGTIFSVQKPNMDFMSLEMRAGELFLTVENGGGEFTATFSPAEGEFSLCDGEWHQIIVNKDRYVASLTVDGVAGADGQSSNTGQSEANTNDPLYFGGLPTNVVHDGIIENEHYVGCIRNVAINGNFQSLSQSKTSGDVDIRSCPAN